MSDEIKQPSAASAPAKRPKIIVVNDAPRYRIKEVTLIFTFSDRDSVTHRKSLDLKTGEEFSYSSPKAGRCSGMFCVAWAELENGTHRLLSGRTPYVEKQPWEHARFSPGLNMDEQPTK